MMTTRMIMLEMVTVKDADDSDDNDDDYGLVELPFYKFSCKQFLQTELKNPPRFTKLSTIFSPAHAYVEKRHSAIIQL